MGRVEWLLVNACIGTTACNIRELMIPPLKEKLTYCLKMELSHATR